MEATPVSIGQRASFYHGKRKLSGTVYDIGKSLTCVSVIIGRNQVNFGVDHDQVLRSSSKQPTAGQGYEDTKYACRPPQFEV
jgi:hypothetical protein